MSGANCRALLLSLKASLKARGLTYAELGAEIGLSESGVKKLFLSSDCSLGRLQQICNVLGLRLSDMIQVSEGARLEVMTFTPAQDELLSLDHLCLAAFWLLAHEGKDAKECSRRLGLDDQEWNRVVRRLEGVKLAERHPRGKVIACVPHGKEILWDRSSRLAKTVGAALAKNLVDEALTSDPSRHVFFLRQLRLGPHSRRELERGLADLLAELEAKSSQDRQAIPEDAAGIRLLVAVAPGDFVMDHDELTQP